jgi:hypothetical protein
MCTDLTNDAAPAGAALATLHPKAFRRWLENCGSKNIDEGNPGQIVAMLFKAAEVEINNLKYTPNWHLTAMTDRLKTRCNNFHFKIEASKASSHYWHYVLHYHPANKTWHWVGDENPKITGRNDAGGGAAEDAEALDANRAAVDLVAAVNGLANKVTRSLQTKMLDRLKKMSDDGLIFGKQGVWQ